MNRLRFALCAWLAALTLAAVAPPRPAFAAARNIVLFVTDDQGQDAGAYGNPVIRTPNFDALAREGTLFKYAFATTASCSASRSVILTGLHNHRNGQYGHQHSYHKFSSFDDILSLPVLLEAGGYRTARAGKYHVAPESVYHFQEVIPGSSRNPVRMAENARAFLAARDERPFFLYFATSDPHRGGGRARDLPHAPDRFGNRPDGYPGVKTVTFDPSKVIVPPFLPDTPTCRAELAQYYQAVWRVDQGLGRLLEILRETGHWDDTFVLYISDHGIAFPGAKTTCYEPGLRSPCLARSPSQKRRGLVSEAMVSWVDITPTLLDFAGLLDPAKRLPRREILERLRARRRVAAIPFHGRSFLGILEEERPQGWDEVYASHTFHEITMYYPMRVVRGRRYKLIWNIAHPLPYPFASDLWAAPTWQEVYARGPDALYGKRTVRAYIQRPRFELYDLESDPHEVRNLAEDPAHRRLLEELKAKLRRFQKETGDPWILKWEYE